MIFIIFILFPYLISSLLLQNGSTALIKASWNGRHLDIVRTLLQCGGDLNAQNKVRNQTNDDDDDDDDDDNTINYLDYDDDDDDDDCCY